MASRGARAARGFAAATITSPETVQALCDRLHETLAASASVEAVFIELAEAGYSVSPPQSDARVRAALPLLHRAKDVRSVVRATIGAKSVLVFPLLEGDAIAGAMALVGDDLSDIDDFSIDTCALIASAYVRRLARAQEHLDIERLALIDGLTGIPNRRALDLRLAHEWNRARRGVYAVSAVMIDVDFFGAYNNRYGHLAGDECLHAIAGALTAVISRETDMLARYGGEEFAAILPATDAEGAILVAERLREAIVSMEREHRDTRLGRVTISLGIASCTPDRTIEAATLVSEADASLLRAKAAGRNRVVGAGYESASAPNRRRYQGSHNLPSQVTPFVGRESELAALSTAIDESRIVSIVGLGGIGKSRVAFEAVKRFTDRFADGARYVDLSLVTRAEMVPAAIANALGLLPLASNGVDIVIDQLRNQRQLLLLDNCEHVIEVVAQFVGRIAAECEHVHIIVTTRQNLEMDGENVFRIAELSVEDARALFHIRLRAAEAHLRIREGADATIDAICERLERLPMAIEIVAPRVVELGLEETLKIIADPSFLLRASRRGHSTRQESLWNLLEWSYRLLDAREQTLLQWLSPFVGGIDPNAAASICEVFTPERARALLDKSLLNVDAESGRLRLSRVARDFAFACLRASGNEVASRSRHAEYFVTLAADVRSEMRSGNLHAATETVRTESANFGEALAWLFSIQATVPAAALIAASLTPAWERTGHIEEARYWLNRASDNEEAYTDAVRAEILHGNALVAIARGDHKASISSAQRAADLFELAGDRQMLGSCQALIAHGKLFAGEYAQAEQFYAQGLDNAEATNDRRGIGQYLVNLANIALEWREDLDTATRLYRAGIGIFRELGPGSMLPVALLNYASALYYQAQLVEAVAALEEAIPLFSAMGHKAIGVAYTQLCACRTALGQHEQAHLALDDALDVYEDFPTPRWITFCLQHASALAHAVGDNQRSVQLIAFVESYHREFAVAVPAMQSRDIARVQGLLAQSCQKRDAGRWRQEISAWSDRDALAAARSLRIRTLPRV